MLFEYYSEQHWHRRQFVWANVKAEGGKHWSQVHCGGTLGGNLAANLDTKGDSLLRVETCHNELQIFIEKQTIHSLHAFNKLNAIFFYLPTSFY